MVANRPVHGADDPIVSVTHLRKSYGEVKAVEDVSLQVRAGEIFGILGPNGAGKTTTVECLQGLRRPDGGVLSVLGLDPARQPRALRSRIGSQLQSSALPERMRVWEALDLFGVAARRREDRDALLAEWGLMDKRQARFADLSGGQRQRLFVALALVNRPEVVFLDEMTTGLDPTARRLAWQLIEAIRDRGTTVVLVTHFMDEAERLCDRLAIISAGRVVALDTPERLVSGHLGSTRVRFTPGEMPLGWLGGLDGVVTVERHGDQVEVAGVPQIIAAIGHGLVERGSVPQDLRVEHASLEDVYLELIGEA